MVTKYVSHMATTIVATYFAMISNANVRFIPRIKALVICIPTIIAKLATIAVQGMVARLASKVTSLWEKGAIFSSAMPFSSTPSKDTVLFPRQLFAPFLIGKLKRVLTHVYIIHTFALSHSVLVNSGKNIGTNTLMRFYD